MKISNDTPDHVLRPKSVCEELGISPATFWRIVKSGELKTVKVSERCTGVFRSVLNEYLTKRKGGG